MDREKTQYRWIVISGAFAAFMSTLDSCIVSISLPAIAIFFHVSMGEVPRVNLAFLFSGTGTLMIAGMVADQYGLRRLDGPHGPATAHAVPRDQGRIRCSCIYAPSGNSLFLFWQGEVARKDR